jgi:hypothetical protein
MGSRSDVIRQIKDCFPGTEFDTDSSGYCRTEEFSLEFYISADPCDRFMIALRRGGSEVLIRVVVLLKRLESQAFDAQTGKLFDADEAAKAFGVWEEYRTCLSG